jgi:N-acetylglucosaminyldiphosphoundecaprenol N-acetyl-beta-D-mannosaminyltransferase
VSRLVDSPEGVALAGSAANEIAQGCEECRAALAEWRCGTCSGPVRLTDLAICPITRQQCVAIVLGSLNRGQGGWIVTPNLDHARRCSSDRLYAHSVRDASLCVADGMPLVWASRLQGTPLPERVAGSDLIWALSSGLSQAGRRLFLLGGDPGTAEAAADILRRKYPGLEVAGTCCPPEGFERERQWMQDIQDCLLAAQPDLVFVALGSPKQEYLIQALRPLLPATWWIGVGISFSFVCGQIKRAPKWAQQLGLEWMHRLIQEPRRLAGRYLLQGVPFAVSFLLAAVLQRRGARRLSSRK